MLKKLTQPGEDILRVLDAPPSPAKRAASEEPRGGGRTLALRVKALEDLERGGADTKDKAVV